MFQLGPLVIRNVLRNRRRSILTLASAAVSLAVLGFLVALYQGFFFAEQTSPSEALRLIARHKVSLTNPLPASYGPRIAVIDGVQAVSAWSWFQGVYIDNKPENFFARFAVDPAEIQKVHPEYTGPAEQWTAFQRNRTGCAVARTIAEKHNLKVGDRVNIIGDIYPVNPELTVELIFDHPKNTECMMFHRDYISELMKAQGHDADTVGTFSILARSTDDVPRIARAVDTMFENSSYPTKTESEREFSLSFMAFMGNIKLYLAAICSAVTFTILLVSANSIAMSVRERTREMGILRTLGFTPGEIIGMVLGESILIALLGGLLGMAVTAGLTRAAAAGMGPWGAMFKFR
ncbi:MAG TPA: FtsX-like permease family protein, partial [Tepidisphaeraceae bacterium]|nr:FtsX-like permease family protein [Tepidisphaeraceae bacterium]